MSHSMIRATAPLQNILKDKRRHRDIGMGLNHYMKENRLARKRGLDSASIAAGFHQSVDNAVRPVIEDKVHPISCRKGCAHCCYLNVDITADEADLLLKYAASKKIPIDWARVEEHAKGVSSLPYIKRKCVFLGEDNSCTVYEHRPMACRKYFSVDDPDRCNSEKYPNGGVTVPYSTEAEIIVTALYTAMTSGPLAQMLLKRRKNETER